jgi:hypothetical protein
VLVLGPSVYALESFLSAEANESKTETIQYLVGGSCRHYAASLARKIRTGLLFYLDTLTHLSVRRSGN